VPASTLDRAVVAISAKDADDHNAVAAVQDAFSGWDGPDVEVLVLAERTHGPADTVSLMIAQADIRGAIAIKDSDSFFATILHQTGCFIAVCDVRGAPELSNLGGKSFVILNDQGYVEDIAEKKICSDLISAGLYGFSDAGLFVTCHAALRPHAGTCGLYVSHVMAQAITEGEAVRTLQVNDFVDLDSEKSWRDYCRNHRTLIIEIDGVLIKSQSGSLPLGWKVQDRAIVPNLDFLRMAQQRGTQLIFITSRAEDLREQTLAALRDLELDVHALVMGCRQGQRCLVSDFAPSHSKLAAIAINLERNTPNLAQLLL
jgi:hypothetical protein